MQPVTPYVETMTAMAAFVASFVGPRKPTPPIWRDKTEVIYFDQDNPQRGWYYWPPQVWINESQRERFYQ